MNPDDDNETIQVRLGELEQNLQTAEAEHGSTSVEVAVVLEEYAAELNKVKGRYLDSINAAARAKSIRAKNSDKSLSDEVGQMLDARMAKDGQSALTDRKLGFIVMGVASLFLGWIGAVLMPVPLSPITFCSSVLTSFGYCWFLYLSRSKGGKWFAAVCGLPFVGIPAFWLVYRRESLIPGLIYLLGIAMVWNQVSDIEVEIPALNPALKSLPPRR